MADISQQLDAAPVGNGEAQAIVTAQQFKVFQFGQRTVRRIFPVRVQQYLLGAQEYQGMTAPGAGPTPARRC